MIFEWNVICKMEKEIEFFCIQVPVTILHGVQAAFTISD